MKNSRRITEKLNFSSCITDDTYYSVGCFMSRFSQTGSMNKFMKFILFVITFLSYYFLFSTYCAEYVSRSVMCTNYCTNYYQKSLHIICAKNVNDYYRYYNSVSTYFVLISNYPVMICTHSPFTTRSFVFSSYCYKYDDAIYLSTT